mmetsp:Transcript_44489/g.94873  ORF Transcript_44489/g.94873 Transcript_44489/m.94873 type:complete len:260 (-) Transcript_44489:805-1584(-)
MAWLSNSIAASSSDFACKNSSWVAVRTVRASSITVVWSVIPTWMASILSWRSSLRSSSFSILLPSFLTSYSRSSFSLLCLFSFSIHSSLSTMSCCSSSRSLSISFSICAITWSNCPPWRRRATTASRPERWVRWAWSCRVFSTAARRAAVESEEDSWRKVEVADSKSFLASSESRISIAFFTPSSSSSRSLERSAQSVALRWQEALVSVKNCMSPSSNSTASSRSCCAIANAFLASDWETSLLDSTSVSSVNSLILLCM